jgi:hypothetical protein
MEYNNYVLEIQYCPNVMRKLQILNTTLNKKFCNSKEEEKKKYIIKYARKYIL